VGKWWARCGGAKVHVQSEFWEGGGVAEGGGGNMTGIGWWNGGGVGSRGDGDGSKMM